jgi:predicted PurR-regulated permease PerM
MNKNTGLLVALALVAVLSALILKSYWEYLFFAGLFAILFSGANNRLSATIGKNASAALITVGVIVLLVVPTMYVVSQTVLQAPAAYQGAVAALDKESVRSMLGVSGDEVRALAIALGEKLRQNVLQNAGAYLNQVGEAIIGIVIMFMTLFFLLRDGARIMRSFIKHAPMRPSQVEKLVSHMRAVIHAVVIGQVITALVQGALVGVLLLALGVPNALFWGVIATLLSIIPILGPFLVYLPATIYLFVQDRYVAAIVMLALGILVISQVDNVVRPYIASRTANIHPLIPILGVIGGLKLWGFVGFVLGPLVLAAFVTLYAFATTEVKII